MITLLPIRFHAGLPEGHIPGNPIVDLQQQINALKQRVSKLEGAMAPQEFSVSCTGGDKIADVLAQVAYTNGPVTITISGVCQESLTIYRDNITLRGASTGGGLTPAPSEWFVLNLKGARRIRLENLSITGGGTGLYATSGATFEALNIRVKDASGSGVDLDSAASGSLSNSIIENCGSGIGTRGSGILYVNGGEVKNSNMVGVGGGGGSYIRLFGGFKVTSSGHHAVFTEGGFISIDNAIVEDNKKTGVWAMGGGSIVISGSNTHIRKNYGGVVAWAGSVNLREGVQVTENYGPGISSTFGGHVDLERGVKVEHNEGAGITVGGSSSAQVSGSFIRHNDYDGIQLRDTSVAIFWAEPNEISYNGIHGINCNPVPPNVAQISGNPGTVIGNTVNPQINCPGYP